MYHNIILMSVCKYALLGVYNELKLFQPLKCKPKNCRAWIDLLAYV